MARVLAWLAGIAGIAALGRAFARRRSALPEIAPAAAPEATVDDPAAELRQRLAEQRETGSEPASAAAPVDESLEERRARVHAKAREAIEAMDDDGGAA